MHAAHRRSRRGGGCSTVPLPDPAQAGAPPARRATRQCCCAECARKGEWGGDGRGWRCHPARGGCRLGDHWALGTARPAGGEPNGTRRAAFRVANVSLPQRIRDKLASVLQNSVTMRSIVCVGESEQQYEEGVTLEVLRTQLDALIEIDPTDGRATRNVAAQWLARVVLAYEPVWAIGTGKAASPAEVHLQRRTLTLAGAKVPCTDPRLDPGEDWRTRSRGRAHHIRRIG